MPRLLDLFCGGGGGAVGYQRAGFDVVGVDINVHHHYPFEFHQADALSVLGKVDMIRKGFDAIHASPPCQAFSSLQKQNQLPYPDLVEPVRKLLREIGLPYIIENVHGAPLKRPILLCGTMFPELRVIRHRMFESNLELVAPRVHPPHPRTHTLDRRRAHYGQLDPETAFLTVTGGGSTSLDHNLAAMGVGWRMSRKELNEAIPPPYTEFLGGQLRALACAPV